MHLKFDFSKRKGCSIKTLTLRETDGTDEAAAITRSLARGSAAYINEELLRLAIVEVDGEEAKQPYLALDRWNSKTRALATAAFDKMNAATKEEMKDFLDSAEVVAPSAPSTKSETVMMP